ncbi:MAG: methyltransferase domain-containing protein [Anaerolineae bacterium]|nr:methyltransferase domain-containing protein [Anaerolineae bacterium]
MFPPDYFARQDERDDGLFYTFPRKVVHIDDHAIATLRDLYAKLLPSGGVYLDLMSSWRSHLPESLKSQRVVGLGMNAEEMRDNPQLDKYLVHDLNQNPVLPYEDKLFDAVTCAVSVQYLIQPVAVFAEVQRVLKANGVFVVSFSNRCFPNKAVSRWLSASDQQHVALVTRYFEESGGWYGIASYADEPPVPRQHDPLYAVWGYAHSEDNAR